MAVRTLMLCALISLAGLARGQAAPPEHKSATLSDGTLVTLEGVTYGKERTFGGMSIDQGNAGSTSRPDTKDAIVLWIRCVRPASGPTANMGLQPGAIRLYDDNGKEFISGEQSALTRYLPHNSHAILLYAWPRHSAEVVVEIPYAYNLRIQSPTVKFHVRNPRISQAPPFLAETAPIARRDSELEVTLNGLHQMPPITDWSGPQERFDLLTRGQKLHTLVTFQYKYRGQVSTQWQPTGAEITDSAGNPYQCQASGLYQPSRYPLTYYRSDADEPLKMAVWFHRTANADFADREIGVMNNLPMRLGYYLQTTGAIAKIGDVSVELSSISEVECVGKRTEVTLNVYGGDPHLELFLQVRNERGKSAKGIGPNSESKWIAGSTRAPSQFLDPPIANPRPHRCVDFLLDLPRGTSRISCSIAVNRAHYFEFTPAPAVQPDLQSAGLRR